MVSSNSVLSEHKSESSNDVNSPSTNRGHSQNDKVSHAMPSNQKFKFGTDTICGMFSGVVCAAFFNPWDRALYLSMEKNRPFLSRANFTNPYQGMSQAIVQRSFLGSVYFIMQGQLKSHLAPILRNDYHFSESSTQFIVGMSAGSMNGILTNSTSAIKYHTWGKKSSSFFASACEMWSLGGVKPFINGTHATIMRDMIFGSTYEIIRNTLRAKYSLSNPCLSDSELHFCYDMFSAGVATVASGPLNYVRTKQYASFPGHTPPTTTQTLKTVWQESKTHTPLKRISFFLEKFRVGWGTGRVVVGMACGQQLFDKSRPVVDEFITGQSKNSTIKKTL